MRRVNPTSRKDSAGVPLFSKDETGESLAPPQLRDGAGDGLSEDSRCRYQPESASAFAETPQCAGGGVPPRASREREEGNEWAGECILGPSMMWLGRLGGLGGLGALPLYKCCAVHNCKTDTVPYPMYPTHNMISYLQRGMSQSSEPPQGRVCAVPAARPGAEAADARRKRKKKKDSGVERKTSRRAERLRELARALCRTTTVPPTGEKTLRLDAVAAVEGAATTFAASLCGREPDVPPALRR